MYIFYERPIKTVISNLTIFPLISVCNIVSINELTLILKIISHCNVKSIMMLLIKSNVSLEGLDTSVTSGPIRLTTILVIMLVLTFKTDIILYFF